MSRDERIQKILDSWHPPRRLKEDTWQNVQLVLDYYGFTCIRKREWVCSHELFAKLAKKPNAGKLLKSANIGPLGDFAIAVTHGSNRKSGMVVKRYLDLILGAIEFLEFLRRKEDEL